MRPIAALLATFCLAACGTPGQRWDPVANLREISLSDARIYARATQAYIDQHGAAATISATEDSVRRKMKDPDSTKFQNIEIVRYGDGALVCGEVNSKNSYGGYVGYKRFFGGPDDRIFIENDDSQYAEINAAANTGLYDACVYRTKAAAPKKERA